MQKALAYSCFSIAVGLNVASNPNERRKEIRWSSSICISNLNPWEVVLLYEFGGDTQAIVSKVNFNTRKHVALYRIDWEPNLIKFYVKGEFIGKIRSKENVYIPKTAVYMSAGVIPANMTRRIETAEGVVSLFIYRVQYVKWEPDIHQDLRTIFLPSSWNSLLWMIFISMIFTAILAYYFWRGVTDETDLSGYYVHLREEDNFSKTQSFN